MTELMGYGGFIRHHRLESGFKSQRQLAECTGISSATISRIEAEIQRPETETLLILSKHLKTTTFADLMEIAGYFEGLDGEKLIDVKEFFEKEKGADDSIELCLKQIISLNDNSAIEKTKNIIIDLFSEESEEYGEIGNTVLSLMDFVRFAASGVEMKEILLSNLRDLINKYKNSDSFISEKEFGMAIDLTDEHEKVVIVDGRQLTEKELKKFVAMIRLERHLE